MNEERAVIQQMVDALDHADELLGGSDTLVMNGAAAGRWLLEQPAQRPLVIKAIADLEQALAAPVQEKNQSPYPEYDRGFSNGWDRGFAAAQTAPVQEPEYWNVIDPAGNSVASETNAIRGWARIAGSYKPTVEGLLGFHDQGWRVLPKVTSPAPQPVPVKTYSGGKPWPVQPKPWVGLSDEELNDLATIYSGLPLYRAIEAKLRERNK